MTLKDCYMALEGDYVGVMERLKKEETVLRFIKMFSADDSCAKLQNAMSEGDVQAAFRAAHSLKGNCMSLGLTRLQTLAEKLTEPLRRDNVQAASEWLEPLKREYERAVALIRQLDA